jgi:succinate dehydrogenase flavin-adding protein (antitoxin of CptAB toxin-antitoxin module)
MLELDLVLATFARAELERLPAQERSLFGSVGLDRRPRRTA